MAMGSGHFTEATMSGTITGGEMEVGWASPALVRGQLDNGTNTPSPEIMLYSFGILME